MKKSLLIIFLLFITFNLAAQESTPIEDTVPEASATIETQETTPSTSEKTSALKKLIAEPWFTVSFNEGVSYGQLTRIEILKDRSNFVRENFLIGAFVNAKTDNFWLLDFVLQIGAYYPFYNAFNGMEQFAKNPILYAIDSYFGVVYSVDIFKYVLFDISLGMHYMYQLTDEYHMCYLGLGTLNTIEFPIAKNWTIVNNYFFSYDDANLGSNKKVQKFNASYQYHIDLGIRYSRKAPNSYYYIDVEKIRREKQAEVPNL